MKKNILVSNYFWSPKIIVLHFWIFVTDYFVSVTKSREFLVAYLKRTRLPVQIGEFKHLHPCKET